MNKMAVMVILLMGFSACESLDRHEEGESTGLKAIPPIYYIGEIEIEDPVIVFFQSVPYITSESVAEGIGEQKHILLSSNKVYGCLTDSLLQTRYRPRYGDLIAYQTDILRFANKYHLDIRQNALNVYRHSGGYEVGRFSVVPKNFVLLMVSETAEEIIVERDSVSCYDEKIVWDMRPQTYMIEVEDGTLFCRQDYVSGYRYSNRYVPVVAPVWSKRQSRALAENNGLISDRQNGGIINE